MEIIREKEEQIRGLLEEGLTFRINLTSVKLQDNSFVYWVCYFHKILVSYTKKNAKSSFSAPTSSSWVEFMGFIYLRAC